MYRLNVFCYGYLEQTLYKRLVPKYTALPQLYGLPKVHKPLVPIVCTILNTPIGRTSSFVKNSGSHVWRDDVSYRSRRQRQVGEL